jgi:hypothetical protein
MISRQINNQSKMMTCLQAMPRTRAHWLMVLMFAIGCQVKAQKTQLRELHPSHEIDNLCQGSVSLGSGFERSGMNNRVVPPRILESYWRADTLFVRLAVVLDCCPHDYLGYTLAADSLVLYYGVKSDIPPEKGEVSEIRVCLCVDTGCCYEFEYEIPGLNKATNYWIGAQDVVVFRRLNPFPLQYLYPEKQSILYSSCDNLDRCFREHIEQSIVQYRKLLPLYEQLLGEIETDHKDKYQTIEQLRRIWWNYFSEERAIMDPYLRTRLAPGLWDQLMVEQRAAIAHELEKLSDIMNKVSRQVRGGLVLGEEVEGDGVVEVKEGDH